MFTLSASDNNLLDVEVLALFKDVAVLSIDGERQLLKVSGDAVSGVVLISSDSQSAVVEYAKVRKTLTLSEKISAVFKVPENLSVSILRNTQGQYKTSGSINDIPVMYLVDTGASIVAMSSLDAKILGIEYESQPTGEAVTASGRVKSWKVVLDRVQVGQITRQNVAAVILEGEYPTDILLGMTFLSQVSMQESDGVLMLMSKF
jgi:aspartyl protease family protein